MGRLLPEVMADVPAELFLSRALRQGRADAARPVFGGDRRDHVLGGAGGGDRAALPEGKAGPSTERRLECWVRMYLAHQFFNLSKKGIEDAAYNSNVIWSVVDRPEPR